MHNEKQNYNSLARQIEKEIGDEWEEGKKKKKKKSVKLKSAEKDAWLASGEGESLNSDDTHEEDLIESSEEEKAG